MFHRSCRRLLRLSIIAVFLLTLSLLACTQVEETASPENELDLVWEAWTAIEENYASPSQLDAESATAGVLERLMRLGEISPYPFLTDVGRARGQTPPGVPPDLRDVWRGIAMFRLENPDFAQPVLVEAVLDGMVRGLGDPSAGFVTAEQYPMAQEQLESSQEGSYLGIGTGISNDNGELRLSPFRDSQAEKAGVEEGDVLLAVDGIPVAGQAMDSIAERVRGPAGTKVTLQLRRTGEPDPVELDVFRENVELNTINSRLVPGGIGHIWISRFSDATGDQVYSALEELDQYDMLALILDLRSNPGGSAAAASEVAGQFLPPGSLFRYVEDREDARTEDRIMEDVTRLDLEDISIAVLVNDRTSGEAEALAAALQEAERVFVVGTPTFGEGSSYDFVELSDGSALYIPTTRWYAPSGHWLGESGLTPDMLVPFEEEEEGYGGESQFNRAYEYLDDMLPPFR